MPKINGIIVIKRHFYLVKPTLRFIDGAKAVNLGLSVILVIEHAYSRIGISSVDVGRRKWV